MGGVGETSVLRASIDRVKILMGISIWGSGMGIRKRGEGRLYIGRVGYTKGI
jgi:hypothetical protein